MSVIPRRRRLTLDVRHQVTGYLFIMPFLIGFALFFIVPFAQSVFYSLHKLTLTPTGAQFEYVRLANYERALFIDPLFTRRILETVIRMVLTVPLVLCFSFFTAAILNQKFKGRMVARVIFFLPVITSSSIVVALRGSDYIATVMGTVTQASLGFFDVDTLGQFFERQVGLPKSVVDYLVSAANAIPEIVRLSGIQMLVFLAGLQSIPRALYEAAEVEGSTGWESFWLITFPMISPLILTNMVYTLVDFFVGPSNTAVLSIRDAAFGALGHGVSCAMSMIYFAAVSVVIAISVGVVSRRVFYYN